MASNAVIGSLRVNLGMDSAEFQNGARRAQSTLAGLGSTIKSFAAGAVAALSFGAITASIKTAVDHMDELGKTAQKIGIPVEQLSGLEYAARLADLSLGDLQSNLSKFNRALGEIAGGGKNDAGAALRAIGVSALDANGKLRPTADLVADIAEKFQGYSDGAEKAALAQAIFGKSGADMIPLLNGGRDAIAGATEQAGKFGLIVSQDAAKAAEQFNDNLTTLKAAGEGLTNQVAQALLPAMVDLTDGMVAFAEKGVIAEQIAEALKFIMQETARFILEASAAWQEITTWVNAAGQSFEALTSGDFAGAATAWSDASANVAAIWADTAERIKQVEGEIQRSNTVLKGDLPATAGGKSKPRAPVIASGSKSKKSDKEQNKLLNEAKSIYERVRTPAQEYADTVNRLNLLHAKGLITQETYNRAMFDAKFAFKESGVAAYEATETFLNFGDVLKDSFGDAFSSLVDGTKSVSQAFNDMGRDILSTVTNFFANKAFSMLFDGMAGHPLYGGGAGGGLGGIFGSLFGFAKGGTIMPGGTGGIDSQLVAFRKSPNERVDITKPGQMLNGGGGETKIVINNNAGVDVKPSRTSDGGFRFDINKAVSDVIGGGGADKAMGGRFGVPPSRMRR